MDSNKKLFLESLQTKALKTNSLQIWVEEAGDCINSRQSLNKAQVFGTQNHSRNSVYILMAKVINLLKNTLEGGVDSLLPLVFAFKTGYSSKRWD